MEEAGFPDWKDLLGIVEIFLLLIVALIVIPPDHLPEVMQAVGKILRELRLASNTVVRELSGVLEEPTYTRPPPVMAPQPEPPKTPEPPAQT